MARVTAEDCLLRVTSPFSLIRIAAKRARQLARGAQSELPWHDHKSTVLALQEIAGGQVTESVLDEVDLPPIAPPSLNLDPFDAQFK
ncbi:MAG: DNA-directed RNA polymerase subunit omega [Gammaproteobacteria bacterium]|nr:DNA-directed RNA polymerase subunit omega [Gammaproteobacteria bacterium]